ncbi:MAG: hypothetical protein JNK32_11545 [Anaerolineales bacterium]|nr:hypothetical protein [Anaerolineales bacterium]
MQNLEQSLQKADIGHLRIIAGFWGLELESNDFDSALKELCASLLDLEAVSETLDVLSADTRTALNALIESEGQIEWAIFARKYGDIREMGAGRRDRERPHLKPGSTSEALYYRGLLAKAFFDAEKGPQEFAYIPEDLLEIINEVVMDAPEPSRGKSEPLGRPATPVEKAFEMPAADFILDDATTYLAALRTGLTDQPVDPRLPALLTAANIIFRDVPQTEAVKKFLEAPRADALAMLYKAWYESTAFDELRLLPGIICEGEWKNQPQVTREFLVNLVNDIPQGKWWSLPAFIRAVKEKYPDYQRPAGDYDSWFIKRESDGQFLRGFAYWDTIDGALIKYLIQVLHLLGKVDMASPGEGKEATAFFHHSSSSEKKDEKGKIAISSNGRINISRYFSRAVRYQIARFCEWGGEKNDEYSYTVSARSLNHANKQGLKAEQLLAMLVKYTNGTVPPALVKALKRWDAQGAEARVENLIVLRVSRPEIMEEMRTSKAGKFLGELLSPTAVVVKGGATEKVMAALAELGLLAEVISDK